MDKKAFVQQVVIHYRCKPQDVGRAVAYAEQVWDQLTALDYGGKKQGAERRTVDYYAKLTPEQQDQFDKFWEAYRKKDGKQRAALSWGKINPDAETFSQIMHGAQYESRVRNDRGTTPPWAELWLNERRWEDAPKSVDKREETSDTTAGDVAHAEQMRQLFEAQGQDNMAEYWAAQIQRLQAKADNA